MLEMLGSTTFIECPAHPGSSVIRAGMATRKVGAVQRYRCRPDSGSSHLFVPGPRSPWAQEPAGVQVVCRWHPGELVVRHGSLRGGPIPQVRFLCRGQGTRHTFSMPVDVVDGRPFAPDFVAEFPVDSPAVGFGPESIAATLRLIGAGTSFRGAAGLLRPDVSWRIPARWCEQFGPAVARAVLPSRWPAEILVGYEPLGPDSGSLGLLVAAERTGQQSGRLVSAIPVVRDDAAGWAELFAGLQGRPDAVVGPAGSAARSAAEQAWGGVEWRSSQWHARREVRRLAFESGVPDPQGLAVQSLRSVRDFDDCCGLVSDEFPSSPLDAYLRTLGDDMRVQLERAVTAAPLASQSSAPVKPLSGPIVAALAQRRGRLSRLGRLKSVVGLMVAHQRGDAPGGEYERVVRRTLRSPAVAAAVVFLGWAGSAVSSKTAPLAAVLAAA